MGYCSEFTSASTDPCLMTELSTRAQDIDFTVHCHDNVCCLLRSVAVFDKTAFNKSCTKTCLLSVLPSALWGAACTKSQALAASAKGTTTVVEGRL